jgi:hypothetical protein
MALLRSHTPISPSVRPTGSGAPGMCVCLCARVSTSLLCVAPPPPPLFRMLPHLQCTHLPLLVMASHSPMLTYARKTWEREGGGGGGEWAVLGLGWLGLVRLRFGEAGICAWQCVFVCVRALVLRWLSVVCLAPVCCPAGLSGRSVTPSRIGRAAHDVASQMDPGASADGTASSPGGASIGATGYPAVNLSMCLVPPSPTRFIFWPDFLLGVHPLP